MRPGYLYFSTFAFFAFTGGRFTAPFLKEVAGFDDSFIGVTIAIQLFFQFVLGSVGAIYSDILEFKYPNRGRVYFLAVNIAGATLSFGTHGLIQYVFRGDSRDHPLAQILHFVARIFYSAFWAVIFPVCDGITLSHLKSHGDDDEAVSNFGKERLLGAISWAIASLIIGPIVDRFGFGALCWATPILSLLCFVTFHKYVSDALAWTKVNPPCDNENNDVLENADEETNEGTKESREDGQSIALLKSMLGSYTAIGYVICGFALYMGTGVVENLIFLFFEALGGTNTMCGLTVAVTVLFEIPIFYWAPNLLEYYGAENLQKIACLAYVTRVVGYTCIPKNHVALVLLFEPLHGVTYACTKTSSVDFAERITPKGYEASGQGMISLLIGLGSVVGLILGGWIEDDLGPVILYRLYAGIVGTGLLIFYIAIAIDGRAKSTYRQLQ